MNDITAFLEISFQSVWAERMGWMLLNSLWQIVLLSGTYATSTFLLRNRSAASRYIVGCVTLLAMLAMPMATYVLLLRDAAPITISAVAPPPENSLAVGLPHTVSTESSAGDNELVEPAVFANEPPAGPIELTTRDSVAAPLLSHFSASIRPWLPLATTAWLAGVLLLSLRPLWGWIHVRRLQRHGLSPLSESVQLVCSDLLLRLGVRRAVRFSQSVLVEVPTVVGYLRPLVLLPASAITGLSTSEVEMILAHELAHVRRHDYIVNLLQTVIEAFLFYHPGMWWVSNQIRGERENCCDDIAVATSGSRASYVRALARLEEQRSMTPVTVLAATGGSLLQRVRRIASQRHQVRNSQRSWVATAIVFLLICGIVPITLAIGGLEVNDFDFYNPPAGYEKEVRMADNGHRIQAGHLQFHLSDFERTEDGALEASLDVDEGYEVVSFRLFDHKTHRLIHDSEWQRAGEEYDLICDVQRVGKTDRIRIKEKVEALPAEIDVWLRIVENENGLPIAIPAREGAVIAAGDSMIVVSKLFRGSMSGKSGPSGRMIWDPNTVHGIDSETTVSFENRGDLLLGRYHLVAIRKDGSRHAMDDRHFRDFRHGRHCYMHLAVPFGSIDHFELVPFKARHKFFFNGLSVPRTSYLHDVPAHATQVKLSHGGALRLIALGKPNDSTAGWWAPTGEPIVGEPDWQRFRKNWSPSGAKLIAILEAVHPGSSLPSVALGPNGEEWSMPMYFARPVKFIGESSPLIQVGFGAGEWSLLGKCAKGATVGDGDFQVAFTEVNSLGAGLVIGARVQQLAEVEFALVAVGKDGLIRKSGQTYNPSADLDKCNREWVLQQPVGNLLLSEFSHVEVLTRPRAWAEFSGFAVEPSQRDAHPIGKSLPIPNDEFASKSVEVSELTGSVDEGESGQRVQPRPQSMQTENNVLTKQQTLSIISSSGKPIAGARVQFDKDVLAEVNGQKQGKHVRAGLSLSDTEGKAKLPEDASIGKAVRVLNVRVEADGYVPRHSAHSLSMSRDSSGKWYLGVSDGVLSTSVVLLKSSSIAGCVLGPRWRTTRGRSAVDLDVL